MRITITVTAGLLALAAIAAAVAHSEPVLFQPAPGVVLDEPPQRVDAWFTQEMRRSGEQTSLAVYPVLPDGMLADPVSGDTVIDDSDRRHMYTELAGGLTAGQYVVAWSALSDEDDHAESDCYRFFVGREAADAAVQAEVRLDAAEECATMGFISTGAAAQSNASISLTVPEVIESGDVTVGLLAEGVQIRLPTNEARDPNFGHYHLYLDIPPNVTHSHNGEQPPNPNDIMTTADSHPFKGLEPGNHVVTAVLFYDDHAPFDPPVLAGASFTVPGGDDGGTGTAIGIAVAVGAAGLLVGGILGLSLRRH